MGQARRRKLKLHSETTTPPQIEVSGIDIKAVKNPQRLLQGLYAHLGGDYTTAAGIYYELDSGPDGPHYEARFLAAILCREALEPHRGIALLREVIAARPEWPEPVYNMGVFLDEVGDYHEAGRAYARALQIKPDFASAHINYGNYQLGQGKPDEAMVHYRRAMEIVPDQAEARVNAAHALLLMGEYEKGWEYYEHRWITPAFKARNGIDAKGSAMWDGVMVPGKRVLVFHEQGFGDTIMCLRYLLLLRAGGMRTIARVPARLRDLVATAGLADEVITEDDDLPPHDCIVPFMSLPYHCKTSFATIPFSDGYLPRERPEHVPPSSQTLVGICWAGSPIHKNDRNRSMSPALLWPLVREFDDCAWVSFQVGPRESEAYEIGAGDRKIETFADTARVLACVDLLITVDTATAHLAGAMGVPTWLCIPAVPDMRWGMTGDETPWYDSVRIFRQPARGDWHSVVRELRDALHARLREGVDAWLVGANA